MIIVPMAGRSSRFYNHGFSTPKHLLPLHGFDVFHWSLRSLEAYFGSDIFIFINHKLNKDSQHIHETCKRLGIRNYKVLTLQSFTLGQAETVYEFTKFISPALSREALHIFNIDTIRPGLIFPAISKFSGWLEVFDGQGEHWSFAQEHILVPNRAVRVVEKVRISNLCSTGAYSFGDSDLFNQVYKDLYLDQNVRNERYVSSLLQKLIELGNEVSMTKIPSDLMIPCGNPLEYAHCLELNFYEMF